jgi:hypothetical protein
MANPLVEAAKHFSLQQLMADPNLCRNVLNDVGAQPAEVFLLVAALEARVPQTLMDHKATSDLSVVEPRLVAELNQRGIERDRAEWAVNAWKDVVSGSPLGQKTVLRQPDPVAATEPVVAATQPAAQSPTVPVRRSGRRRNLIVGAAIAIVIVAGAVVWLAWPSSKHNPTGADHTSSPAAPSTTPASNTTAPLGPPKDVPVEAAVAWTTTRLDVTKGERINITVDGQIGYGSGLKCGPDGVTRKAPDASSIIGVQHAAVIGLVGGSGAPFYVGTDYNGVAPATGRLLLGINDVVVADNSGHFTATVRLQQP